MNDTGWSTIRQLLSRATTIPATVLAVSGSEGLNLSPFGALAVLYRAPLCRSVQIYGLCSIIQNKIFESPNILDKPLIFGFFYIHSVSGT